MLITNVLERFMTPVIIKKTLIKKMSGSEDSGDITLAISDISFVWSRTKKITVTVNIITEILMVKVNYRQ